MVMRTPSVTVMLYAAAVAACFEFRCSIANTQQAQLCAYNDSHESTVNELKTLSKHAGQAGVQRKTVKYLGETQHQHWYTNPPLRAVDSKQFKAHAAPAARRGRMQRPATWGRLPPACLEPRRGRTCCRGLAVFAPERSPAGNVQCSCQCMYEHSMRCSMPTSSSVRSVRPHKPWRHLASVLTASCKQRVALSAGSGQCRI